MDGSPAVGAWRGGPVGTVAEGVLAPNPGPLTLDGTNTWVLAAPGATQAVVVDPGPDDEGHLHAVLAAARARGTRVTVVLLTHGHADHSAGARRLHELTGAPVRAADPGLVLGDRDLPPGLPPGPLRADAVAAAGLDLEVIATPGHTGDSVSLVVRASGDPAEGALVLTGDTVLGRGSSVVAHPDGRLGDYLDSLRLLERLTVDRQVHALLPGHGPVLSAPGTPPVEAVRGYLAHRRQRLDQVRAALADGATTPADVVRRVYADVPRELWPAAELSVRAQLDHLREEPRQAADPAG